MAVAIIGIAGFSFACLVVLVMLGINIQSGLKVLRRIRRAKGGQL